MLGRVDPEGEATTDATPEPASCAGEQYVAPALKAGGGTGGLPAVLSVWPLAAPSEEDADAPMVAGGWAGWLGFVRSRGSLGAPAASVAERL